MLFVNSELTGFHFAFCRVFPGDFAFDCNIVECESNCHL